MFLLRRRSRLRDTVAFMCGTRWRLRQMLILADRFRRDAFLSTRYGHVDVANLLASTPNANSCGQVWAGRVLVYAIRSYACRDFAGVYAKCQFLRTGVCSARSTTRNAHVHVEMSLASTPNANSCGQVYAPRVLVYAIRSCACAQFAGVYAECQFLRTRSWSPAFSSTRNAHVHVEILLASTPNANFCYFLICLQYLPPLSLL